MTSRTIRASRERAAPPPRRSRAWLLTSALLALALGVVLGALGWELQEPGGPLLAETGIVAGIGFGVSGAAWVTACFLPARRGLWAFAVLGALVSLAASAWTFDWAMPAELGWTGTASQAARSALAAAEHGLKSTVGLPFTPCTTVLTGSLGPLRAPYRQCAIPMTGDQYQVTFTAMSENPPGGLVAPIRGVEFTDRSRPISDVCARHLTGTWWAFVGATPNCPFGYHFEPGG